jgi:ribosomal protein S18 acetylase RimI-like enzyme
MTYNDKKRNITLLKLEKKYIKPVSLMLSRAFKDDLKEVFPDPEERRVKTPYVNELYLLYEFSNSKAFITSPKLEGIAVWIHSDKRKKRTFWRILTLGAIWPAMKIGIKALRKMQALDKYMERKHKELAPNRHWYLAVLAVDPKHQGKGYASKLLNEMLSYIDEEGLPCYLETDGEKNVFMYQHFGFEVVDEFVVPGTKDKVVAMLREPKIISNKA